jgi:hypothetical protein
LSKARLRSRLAGIERSQVMLRRELFRRADHFSHGGFV